MHFQEILRFSDFMFSGYDNQNFGGGTQFGGGFNGYGTQSPPRTSLSKKTPQRGHQFSTIKQITSAAETTAENHELLGFIERVDHQDAGIKYTINDWSGATLEVSKHSTTGDAYVPAIAQNTLVHVVGTVRNFGNEFSMTGHSIQPVTSGDQITRHLVGLAFTKIQLDAPIKTSATTTANAAGTTAAGAAASGPASYGFAGSMTAEELLAVIKCHDQSDFSREQIASYVQHRGLAPALLDQLLGELCVNNHMWIDATTRRYVLF